MEPFEMQATAGGGSCLLRGEQLISIDAGAPLRDRAMSLARALSEIERQTVSMVPEARDVVKAMKGSRPKRGPEELAIISTRAAFRRRHSVPRLDEGAEDHRYERLPRPRDSGLRRVTPSGSPVSGIKSAGARLLTSVSSEGTLLGFPGRTRSISITSLPAASVLLPAASVPYVPSKSKLTSRVALQVPVKLKRILFGPGMLPS